MSTKIFHFAFFQEKSAKRFRSLSPKRQSLSDGDLSPPVLEPSWSALPQCNDSRVPPILTPNDDDSVVNNCDDPLASFNKLSSNNNNNHCHNNNNNLSKKKINDKIGCDIDRVPPDIVEKRYGQASVDSDVVVNTNTSSVIGCTISGITTGLTRSPSTGSANQVIFQFISNLS